MQRDAFPHGSFLAKSAPRVYVKGSHQYSTWQDNMDPEKKVLLAVPRMLLWNKGLASKLGNDHLHQVVVWFKNHSPTCNGCHQLHNTRQLDMMTHHITQLMGKQYVAQNTTPPQPLQASWTTWTWPHCVSHQQCISQPLRPWHYCMDHTLPNQTLVRQRSCTWASQWNVLWTSRDVWHLHGPQFPQKLPVSFPCNICI